MSSIPRILLAVWGLVRILRRMVADSHLIPIRADTQYCAVYGQPIRHSASPAMQNAALAHLGLNWRYLAFEVNPNQLREAIGGALAMRFIGLNLTIPHKLLAVEMVDQLDESARTWGAVNTICFEGWSEASPWQPLGKIDPGVTVTRIRSRGYNTDADAIIRSVREDLGMELAGASVLVLGAGGAGRVASLKLAAAQAKKLYLMNRTVEKAAQLVQEIRNRFPNVSTQVGYPESPVDLILNATSLGLKTDDPLPLDERDFPLTNTGAVYDMIYRPARTALLERASTAGCRVANGLGMLLYQGAAAFEIWTGRPAPLEVMKRALWENVYP